MFSIIIPTYNRAHFLPKAIESVLEQTYSNWELIIIDDGSTDNTLDVVENYADERIKYIYQENAERSAARNNGIRHANGEYICFLDSDDYFLKNRLTNLDSFIAKQQSMPFFIITNIKKELNNQIVDNQIGNSSEFKHASLFQNMVTPNMVCIHKSLFDKDLFIEKFKTAYWEDTHLWIRLSVKHGFVFFNDNSVVQVEHDSRSINEISKDKLRKRYADHLAMVKDLFNNHEYVLKGVENPAKFRRNYFNNRHILFLYMSRINKHYRLSLTIWLKALKNNPSLYLLKELGLLHLNYFGLKSN